MGSAGPRRAALPAVMTAGHSMTAGVAVTIVLYRPDLDLLNRTLAGLRHNAGATRRIGVLCSAPADVTARVRAAVELAGLDELTTVIGRSDNLGFAGGHNLLLAEAFADEGVRHVLVLNPDVEMAPGALARLEATASSTAAGSPCLVGPALVLRRRTDPQVAPAVDSLGIRWDRWGRHVDMQQGEPVPPLDGSLVRVQGLTGACLLVSREAYERLLSTTGEFFDAAFLAYREDAELGRRAASSQITLLCCHEPGFTHWRGTLGSKRGNALVDLLGVRNRFLLRSKLGPSRPGWPVLPSLRDAAVVLACLSVERSSRPGVVEAWRIRRWMRNKGRQAGLRD